MTEDAPRPDIALTVNRDPEDPYGIFDIRLLAKFKMLERRSSTSRPVNTRNGEAKRAAAESKWHEAYTAMLTELVAQTAFGLHVSHLLGGNNHALACMNESYTRMYHHGDLIAIEVAESSLRKIQTRIQRAADGLYRLYELLEPDLTFSALANSFFLGLNTD